MWTESIEIQFVLCPLARMPHKLYSGHSIDPGLFGGFFISNMFGVCSSFAFAQIRYICDGDQTKKECAKKTKNFLVHIHSFI